MFSFAEARVLLRDNISQKIRTVWTVGAFLSGPIAESLRFKITETGATWSSSEVTFLSECKPIYGCHCGFGCLLGFKSKHPHLTILVVSNDAIALAGPVPMFHRSIRKLHQT
jgi:hypothetical protein